MNEGKTNRRGIPALRALAGAVAIWAGVTVVRYEHRVTAGAAMMFVIGPWWLTEGVLAMVRGRS